MEEERENKLECVDNDLKINGLKRMLTLDDSLTRMCNDDGDSNLKKKSLTAMAIWRER
jgi:hypothetical protein